MRTSTKSLKDTVVIQLRKAVKMGNADTHQAYARQYGVTKSVVGKAIRGDSFKHLNAIETPFRKVPPRSDREVEVLRLYNANVSQADIAKTLNMSKTTIGILCKEIADKRKAAHDERRALGIKLYLAGELSVKQIADQLGVTEKSTGKWFRGLSDSRTKIPKIKRPRAISAPLSPVPYEEYLLYHFKSYSKQRVRLVHKVSNKTISMELIRYRMSVHLGRVLNLDEVIVPIDQNGDNDDLGNLKVITRVEYRESIGIPQFRNCLSCKVKFTPRNRTHVMCSDKCRKSMMPTIFRGSRKSRILHRCVCEICETPFQSYRRNDDVCYSQECKTILKSYGG